MTTTQIGGLTTTQLNTLDTTQVNALNAADLSGCDFSDAVLVDCDLSDSRLKNARFAEDQVPLDERCSCPVCATWTRAYLHHLIRSGEMLGMMLMSWANIAYYQSLMATRSRTHDLYRIAEEAVSASSIWPV